MRKIALAALILAALYGTLAAASDAAAPALQDLGLDTADTGSWATDDTATAGDDTATGGSDDTSDGGGDDTSTSTGDDTAADTGDTGATDTGRWGYSAAELAGETGGFGCASLGGRASGLLVLLSVTLLAARRRED